MELSKYELATVISVRVEQLRRGAQPHVVFVPTESQPFDPFKVALMELREGKCPLMLRRCTTAHERLQQHYYCHAAATNPSFKVSDSDLSSVLEDLVSSCATSVPCYCPATTICNL